MAIRLGERLFRRIHPQRPKTWIPRLNRIHPIKRRITRNTEGFHGMVPRRFVQPDTALADKKKNLPDQLWKTTIQITIRKTRFGHQNNRMAKKTIFRRKNSETAAPGNSTLDPMPDRRRKALFNNTGPRKNTRDKLTQRLAERIISMAAIICNQSRNLSKTPRW